MKKKNVCYYCASIYVLLLTPVIFFWGEILKQSVENNRGFFYFIILVSKNGEFFNYNIISHFVCVYDGILLFSSS